MLVITARNVNEALSIGLIHFSQPNNYRVTSPRGMTTWEYNSPVATVYKRPQERVLFWNLRDANPFFHFFESLWILAGRDDVKFLKHLLPTFDKYSDNGSTFHGAYGARMYRFSQLRGAVDKLLTDRNSRRAVVSLYQPDMDSDYYGSDQPCNCTVTFKIRDDRLNMTVFNRSNDVILGAYGANAVQFSMLQELMAMWLDVEVGEYVQISDSYHVYVNDQTLKLLNDPYEAQQQDYYLCNMPGCSYPAQPYALASGGASISDFMWDLTEFFATFDLSMDYPKGGTDSLRTPFFHDVVAPMWECFQLYRVEGNLIDAAAMTSHIAADDWRLASSQWLERRIARRQQKQG